MTDCGNSWLMYGREFEVMVYQNPGEGIEKIICLDDGIAISFDRKEINQYQSLQ